ncbi:2Fe-2S iron-sulfur cluster binding domain-containing protein [Chloroflexales bacterium ZM16-3]|nr:2Fe-2S iron-sulfur cluster binding domain-containing protein [Chloroflexales bacterium ZM16-3]
MAQKKTYTVRFEPVGVEMEVEEGEFVLNAAFRQGIMLMHGCKEGQCSSCKSILMEGDIELLKYSTFALPDYERGQDYVLLCRTQAYSDLVVELLNYDEELLLNSLPVKEYAARISAIEALTHDIRRLVLELEQPMRFRAGQYVDITIPGAGITRSFSMANPPSEQRLLEFIIKIYPDGAFSSQLRDQLRPGDTLELKGPYGTCFRRDEPTGPLILVGGGSGMAPLWSILNDHIEQGDRRRPVLFFYGARGERDLFYLDKIAAIQAQRANVRFVPALSQLEVGSTWEGAQGYIHEVLGRHLQEGERASTMEAYTCGPPPMIDAVLPVLERNGVKPDRIHVDRFTQAVR